MDCLKKKKRARPAADQDGLETDQEYAERWMSIRIIYFTIFLMSLGFSIVITGVWPYLQKLDPGASKEYMGYVVAANPFAQMLFSPLIGWWGNRSGSIRQPLLATLVVFTAASALFSALEVLPVEARKHTMLASRFLVGASAANIAACRSYLSAATRLKERTAAVSMVSLAQVLGFIVGPGLQAAVTALGEKGVSLGGGLRLDMYTAASWINVLFGVVNFAMFLPVFFKEKRIAAREAMLKQGADSEEATWRQVKPAYFSVWTLIVAFFVLSFNFVLLETLGTPLTMDQFAWTKKEALKYMGILMAIGAVIACATFIAIVPLCKRFGERRVLIWGGFFLMVLGRALYMPWGSEPALLASENTTVTSDDGQSEQVGCPPSQEWCATTASMTVLQFILGFVVTAIGYPIGITLIQTLYSKILGPRPQGVWMGLVTGSGCLSRCMGPVFVTYVYTHLGTTWTFGITTAIMVVSMVWLLIFQGRLIVPEEVEERQRQQL
ncbi:major facilitator superfamily domain-containing protein 8, partial [Frankliniella occidentalis]|uniref:Major facilitator superfamily domain-containing protein 8 n=1 Tax=Frankliniella occidentalis TaxID=133901 RepID=A0A9C6XS11_FRAOC